MIFFQANPAHLTSFILVVFFWISWLPFLVITFFEYLTQWKIQVCFILIFLLIIYIKEKSFPHKSLYVVENSIILSYFTSTFRDQFLFRISTKSFFYVMWTTFNEIIIFYSIGFISSLYRVLDGNVQFILEVIDLFGSKQKFSCKYCPNILSFFVLSIKQSSYSSTCWLTTGLFWG